jgi:hypothetical protein
MITPINRVLNSDVSVGLVKWACVALQAQNKITNPNRISNTISPFLNNRKRKKYKSPAPKKMRLTAKIKEDTLIKSAGL